MFITDTHIRANSPQSRKDDLVSTMKAKLTEVLELASSYNIHALIHGGDFFDTPTPGLSAARELVGIMAKIECPIYGVVGNHDIFGHNETTVSRALLGFAAELGFVTLLTTNNPIYLDDGHVRVQLTGQGFHSEMDRRDRSLDYAVRKLNCDVAIHVVHGMLVDKPLFPGAPYTLIDDFSHLTEADFTLAGHNHLGFPDVQIDGKTFLNPGALVRLSGHQGEIERWPQLIIIDLEGRPSYKKIRLSCAKAGTEVLQPASTGLERTRALSEFVAELRSAGTYQAINLETIIEELCEAKNLPQEVKLRALQYLDEARQGIE